MTDTPDTSPEAVERLLDEVYDTVMEVERNPSGAFMAIQALSAALEAEKARAEATESRERALLKSNDQERKALVENASLRHRLKAAEAERDALKAQLAEAVRVIRSQLGSVLYPEHRSGYETVEEMRKRHAEERALAVNTYVGAKDDDEAVAMSHSAAISVIRGARKRLEDRKKIALAALAALTAYREARK